MYDSFEKIQIVQKIILYLPTSFSINVCITLKKKKKMLRTLSFTSTSHFTDIQSGMHLLPGSRSPLHVRQPIYTAIPYLYDCRKALVNCLHLRELKIRPDGLPATFANEKVFSEVEPKMIHFIWRIQSSVVGPGGKIKLIIKFPSRDHFFSSCMLVCTVGFGLLAATTRREEAAFGGDILNFGARILNKKQKLSYDVPNRQPGSA